MTKNTPRIFISLLLMLLCIGILPVSAFASGGDYPDDALPAAESSAADAQETKQIGTVTTNGGNLNVRTGAGLDNTAFTQLPNGTAVDVIGRDGDWVKILLPARVGYVYGSYLTVTDAADSTASIGGMTGGSDALTPDGNLTLIDDIGSSTKAGKQFITLESKNGNVFYMIIDRDDAQPKQTVGIRVPCGEEQRRDIRFCPQRPEQRKSIPIRQVDIQDHQLRLFCRKAGAGSGAALGGSDMAISCAQQLLT